LGELAENVVRELSSKNYARYLSKQNMPLESKVEVLTKTQEQFILLKAGT